MSGVANKRRSDRQAVRQQIIRAADKAFTEKGVRPVRMDDIAAALSISKRTLYELFRDKETLLLEVMKNHRDEMKHYMEQLASGADNVLEVLLKFYEHTLQGLQATNRAFFEDMKMYPLVRAYIEEVRKENAAAAIEFYRKGVAQGIFRPEVNYDIAQAMVCEQMDHLLQSEACLSYSLPEVYETVIFMHMRGISTRRGLEIMERFVSHEILNPTAG